MHYKHLTYKTPRWLIKWSTMRKLKTRCCLISVSGSLSVWLIQICNQLNPSQFSCSLDIQNVCPYLPIQIKGAKQIIGEPKRSSVSIVHFLLWKMIFILSSINVPAQHGPVLQPIRTCTSSSGMCLMVNTFTPASMSRDMSAMTADRKYFVYYYNYTDTSLNTFCELYESCFSFCLSA